MRDLVMWEPGFVLCCALCGHERGGDDPPGPWFRHRPSHRRRIPIYKAKGWPGLAVPLGYLEYVRP